MTTDGKALTGVYLIDFDTGNIVYDQLVKPPCLIATYPTQ